ncbi:DUF3703 domain-containing protein [Pseudonocardiaceae bacterium YIM PH 21723]|nr:DUF3703 domain-containing protein [Pseudonocardiaceae bacterium YIM PH 21723]
MNYAQTMELGNRRLADGDWQGAYAHFGRAHGLGHDVLAQHLAAHRGMLRAAVRGCRPGKACTQLFLLVMAYLFER